jgi:hypothetical protein
MLDKKPSKHRMPLFNPTQTRVQRISVFTYTFCVKMHSFFEPNPRINSDSFVQNLHAIDKIDLSLDIEHVCFNIRSGLHQFPQICCLLPSVLVANFC